MAERSRIDDGSVLGCFETVRKLRKEELWFDLIKGAELDKLRYLFTQFLSVFLGEVCGSDCLRPLPPMLGNGQSMDLFKLYSAVRRIGGYEAVSKNGLWVLVAEECGFDSRAGSAVKLIFIKYLDTLDRWLQNIDRDKDSKFMLQDREDLAALSMDVESDLKGFLSELSDEKKNDGKDQHVCLGEREVGSMRVEEVCNCDNARRNVENADGVEDNLTFDSNIVKENSIDDKRRVLDCFHCKVVSDSFVVAEDNFDTKRNGVEDVKGDVLLDANMFSEDDTDGKKIVVDDGKGSVILGSNVVKEDDSNRKRKRQCYSGLLSWIIEVAKDPCNPAVGSLPERSRWKQHGNEQVWKQVLLVREAMFLKGNAESTAEQSIWEIKQKMHPAMYEDHNGSERLRYSQRLVSAKELQALLSDKKAKHFLESSSSDNLNDLNGKLDIYCDASTEDATVGFWDNSRKRKRIPVGPLFQAEVPQWTGAPFESESKWLGTRVWPPEEIQNNKHLIERDPIGKGRQDSCGCQLSGSIECVRFHITQKRDKLGLELGSAFYAWKFNRMGEGLALYGTWKEEKKFQALVRPDCASEYKSFWDDIYTFLPNGKRADLVSYYFNVFLLQRRAYQNRCSPNCIDSDEDDSVFGVTEATISPSSKLYSPKKVHLNFA